MTDNTNETDRCCRDCDERLDFSNIPEGWVSLGAAHRANPPAADVLRGNAPAKE